MANKYVKISKTFSKLRDIEIVLKVGKNVISKSIILYHILCIFSIDNTSVATSFRFLKEENFQFEV